MPHFKTSRRVAVPAAVAYSVAADVDQYKNFLPLLERSTIRGTVKEQGGISTFNAELAVGYDKLNLREAFISHVTCNSNLRTVTATSNDAPFRTMTTTWNISEANGQSHVEIEIDYAMRSMFLQFAVTAAMDMAVSKVLAAFEGRALEVYKASNTI